MPDPIVEYIVDPFPGLGTSPFVLQAYRIHFPAQTYTLNGGSVTFIAHEIVFDDGAIIDVSGAPGQSKVKADPGSLPGANGSDGDPGQKGQNAGEIHLNAKVITGTATLKANGGLGEGGQDGGDGVALYLKRRQRRFAVHNSETSYKKTVLNEEIEYGPQVLGVEAY